MLWLWRLIQTGVKLYNCTFSCWGKAIPTETTHQASELLSRIKIEPRSGHLYIDLWFSSNAPRFQSFTGCQPNSFCWYPWAIVHDIPYELWYLKDWVWSCELSLCRWYLLNLRKTINVDLKIMIYFMRYESYDFCLKRKQTLCISAKRACKLARSCVSWNAYGNEL